MMTRSGTSDTFGAGNVGHVEMGSISVSAKVTIKAANPTLSNRGLNFPETKKWVGEEEDLIIVFGSDLSTQDFSTTEDPVFEHFVFARNKSGGNSSVQVKEN